MVILDDTLGETLYPRVWQPVSGSQQMCEDIEMSNSARILSFNSSQNVHCIDIDFCTLTSFFPCCFFPSSACPQTDTAQLDNTQFDSPCTHIWIEQASSQSCFQKQVQSYCHLVIIQSGQPALSVARKNVTRKTFRVLGQNTRNHRRNAEFLLAGREPSNRKGWYQAASKEIQEDNQFDACQPHGLESTP